MANRYFVTGIGTGIGKTIVSAVLTEYLKADYWKPVQAGDLDESDTLKVKSLVSNPVSAFHPESFRLQTPCSPHLAARIDGLEIKVSEIHPPQTKNTLIIEGAGGIMVPLNDKELISDLIKHVGAEVILVSRNYLGSINHTLLSIDYLKNKGMPVRGIIFNGPENKETQEYILKYSGLDMLGVIPEMEELNKDSIRNVGKQLAVSS